MNSNNISKSDINVYNNCHNNSENKFVAPNNQEITIKFDYNYKIIEIYSRLDEKMAIICEKFCSKMNIHINSIQFLYSGNIIKMDKFLFETINS